MGVAFRTAGLALLVASLAFLAACADSAGPGQDTGAPSASTAPSAAAPLDAAPAPSPAAAPLDAAPPPSAAAPGASPPVLAPGEIRVRLVGPRRLWPGQAFEVRLGPGEHHLYRLDVPAGQLAVVAFEQLGSDVLVQPRDPAGTALVAVDSPTGGKGTEWIYLPGDPGGTFDLLVRGWDAGEEGAYRVRVEPPIPFGPRQRLLARAEQLLAEAYAANDPDAAAAAADRFAQADRPQREAMARYKAGKTLLESRGANAEAVPHLRRAVELFERQGSDYWIAHALTDLSLALQRTGRLAEAERLLLSSLPYHQRGDWWDDHANAYDHLGRLAATYGESDEAFRYFEQGLELLQRMPEDDPERATAMSRLDRRMAAEYLTLGHVEQARLHAERAMAQVAGFAREELLARYVLCRVLQSEPDLPRAARCFADVARGNRELGIEREEAVALVSLGQVLRDLGRLPQARTALEQARSTFEKREETKPLGTVLDSLGDLELEAGRPRRALEHFRRAIERGDDRRGHAGSWFGTARAWRALGEPSRALEALQHSIAMTEEHRRDAVGASLQASFFAGRQESYAMAIDLLMELHAEQPQGEWAERAFDLSERARARALLDLLETVIVQTPGAVSAAERGVVRELEAVEAWRANEAKDGAAEEELAVIDRRVDSLQLRLQRLRAGRRTGRELGREAAGQPLELAVIQRRVLDDDMLLLAYELGRDRSYLWIVSPRSLETVVLPPQAEIEALATRAYELAHQSYRRTARIAAEAALQRLADVLVAPVAERLRGKRLLVRSEGSLQYVPWAALPLPGGRRLLEEHEVVVLPSASVVAALRDRAAGRVAAAGTLAVVADPVFDERDARLRGGAGTPGATRRSATERFDRLPHSSGEARALLELAGGGVLLEGFEATRAAVLGGALGGHRYVHFATHAQIQPRQPALSSLVLAGVDRSGAARSALLRARDVYDLDLPAEVVVLSACRTALGEELAGEGLMGLTQGFFAAGAQRVVASLWDVDDLATARLMELFYGAMLDQGLRPAAALRQAQLSLAREPRWRTPYFWAAFVLQGEPN